MATEDSLHRSGRNSLLEDFRYLLLRLKEDMTHDNVKDLVYIYDMNKEYDTAPKFLEYLENEGKITIWDVHLLIEMFEYIKETPLLKLVNGYCKKKEAVTEKEQFKAGCNATGINPVEITKKATESVDLDAKPLPRKPPPITRPPQCSDVQPSTQFALSKKMGSIEETPNQQVERCDERYKMTAVPPGICLIISNENFAGARRKDFKLSDRPGTKKDEIRLCETFSELGFDIITHQDLTALEIFEVLEGISKKDHSRYDCFVCFILSHGKLNSIYGVDGTNVKIFNLFKGFVEKPSLNGKPKLFFFQACRNETEAEFSFNWPTANCSPDGPDGNQSVSKDFFMGYATPPGHTAWIDNENGSWYITALCDTLKNHAADCDIHQICTKVNNYVSRRFLPPTGETAIPCPAYTLTKQFYFTSKQ